MIPPIAADSRDKRTAVSMLRTAGGSDLLAKVLSYGLYPEGSKISGGGSKVRKGCRMGSDWWRMATE